MIIPILLRFMNFVMGYRCWQFIVAPMSHVYTKHNIRVKCFEFDFNFKTDLMFYLFDILK